MQRPDTGGDRRARLRTIALVVASGLVGAGLASKGDLTAVIRDASKVEPHDCAAAARELDAPRVVEICSAEYKETNVPATGILLAQALRETRKPQLARKLAEGLQHVPHVRGDALNLLGWVGEPADAVKHFEEARQLHLRRIDRAGLARDAHGLWWQHTKNERYAKALEMVAECLDYARAAGDSQLVSICHLAAVRVLWKIGLFKLAEDHLKLADPDPRTANDRARYHFENANLFQELIRSPTGTGKDAQAVNEFVKTIVHANPAGRPDLVMSSEVNLVYSLAMSGKLDEAARHLAIAQQHPLRDDYRGDLLMVAGLLAYKRGDLALAEELNRKAFDEAFDNDDRIDIAIVQARIALITNRLDAAEEWSRRGIDVVEDIRSQQPVALRPWILTSRREPYELLFKTLVRARRFEDALLELDAWQGRTLVESIARASRFPDTDLRSVARDLDRIAGWAKDASTAPLVVATPHLHELRTALQAADTLVLVVADREVWAASLTSDAIEIRRVGSWDELEPRIADFRAKPTLQPRADELGLLLLDERLARTTRAPLRVLVDGPLAALPVAALRWDGKPLIARRPIVRVPRLFDTGCVPAPQPHGATVVGYSSTTRSALLEALEVADLLRTVPKLGTAATSSAVLESDPHAPWHIAAHGKVGVGGGTFELHDRALSALEISARKVGPPLVVLSVCVSGISDDGELSESLAMGFLSAGSSQVVATLTDVGDERAREMMVRFHRAGGLADPVGVLARVSAALADSGNTDWPRFAVFGRDICRNSQ